jgi:acyl-CoA synthetase (AMP-forming)/AMP-acid ligase II
MGDAPIPDWVSQHAGQTPDAPALVFDGVVATYAELDKAAARSAEELRSQGIEAGSLVPIAAVSLPGTVVSLVAGPRVGAVVAPFGPTPP